MVLTETGPGRGKRGEDEHLKEDLQQQREHRHERKYGILLFFCLWSCMQFICSFVAECVDMASSVHRCVMVCVH